MDFGCNRLYMVTRDLYSQFGWRATRRLTWRHIIAAIV
jgi:hypothetical protein